MEQKNSKILEIYKNSTFANIGKKVSDLQSGKITNLSTQNINKLDKKSILEIQKDFQKVVVLPYKTILSEHSFLEFGKIKINPTQGVIKLFNAINNNVGPVPISNRFGVLRVPVQNINIKNSDFDLLKYKKLPEINNLKKRSVLEQKTDDIIISKNKNSLLSFNLPKINEFNTNSILNLNSNFDDIVKLKISSLLDKKLPFEIKDLPYSDVLQFNSRYDDLIIKDINSVLKLYLSSNLYNSIPGQVNFFSDENAVGFMKSAQIGQSFFNFKNLPNIKSPNKTPEKIPGNIKEMPKTPDKPISDINPPAKTLEKPISKLIDIEKTPEKKPAIINLMKETPVKKYIDPLPIKKTPEKLGSELNDMKETPEKLGSKLRDMRETPKKESIPLGVVNFIPDEYAKGFTPNIRFLVTQYDLSKVPELEAFNWNNPPGYPGVLNQYVIFFSKNSSSFLFNSTASDLLIKGFKTPKVPINNSQLIIPPYQYADERLPSWAKSFESGMSNAASKAATSFAKQIKNSLILKVLDLNPQFRNDVSGDSNPLIQSELIWQQLAGEIYFKYNEFGTVIRNVRESVINITSGLVGRQVAEAVIPKIESAVASSTSKLINSVLGMPLVNEEMILMMYHISMGTKYTKSKAYFDRLAKIYNSKYNLVGDNAINYYDEENKYTTKGNVNSSNINTTSPKSTASSLSNFVSLEDDAEMSNLKALLKTFSKKDSDLDYYKIPIGDVNTSGLVNTYLFKNESATFGKIDLSDRPYFSNNIKSEGKIFNYGEQSRTGSIDINYLITGSKNENDVQGKSLRPKNKSVIPSNNFLPKSTVSGRSKKAPSSADDVDAERTYSYLLSKKLRELNKKTLTDIGFPNSENNFSDRKNKAYMSIMPSEDSTDYIKPKKYEDDDLIDFYFEDLSTLSERDETIVIPFRANITSIGDSVNANWSPQDYMGRADKFWIYQGFERRLSVSFDVAINSEDEFIASWNKINYLHGMCYPVSYPAEISMKAPIMAITIGNLFNKVKVILNSFSVNMDGNTLWEIKENFQLPMYIKIQVEFTVLFDDTPIARARHYAQDTGEIDWIRPVWYEYTEGNVSQNNKNRTSIGKDANGNIISTNEVEKANSSELSGRLTGLNFNSINFRR